MSEMVLDVLSKTVSALCELGLGYLSLLREFSTLSHGEQKRCRLSAALSLSVSGQVFLFDEPTAGLHSDEHKLVWSAIMRLVEAGNTAIAIDHSPGLLHFAAHEIRLGPGGGGEGGEIVYEGRANPQAQKSRLRLREADKCEGQFLVVTGFSKYGLHYPQLNFLRGAVTLLSGGSGSGKSTIMSQVLAPGVQSLVARKENSRKEDESEKVTLTPLEKRTLGLSSLDGWETFDDVVMPIRLQPSLSPRSVVGTFSGMLQLIRRRFALSQDAKIKGLGPSAFSFNSDAGWCEECRGLAIRNAPNRVERCQACGGQRFCREVLQVQTRGFSIADVMQMTMRQVVDIYGAMPGLGRLGKVVESLELSHLVLEQPLRTVSDGEFQRLYLLPYLLRRTRRDHLFLFDEPCRGLDSKAVQGMGKLIRELSQAGATVVVIEHNQEIMPYCDCEQVLSPPMKLPG
jgi:excinuclease ABC subunit A